MTAPFHETLRKANRAAWEAMLGHPFVRAVESDQLAPDAFVRYLSYERDFVATAILIFAHALLKAPGFATRRHLVGVLHALANEQISYFDMTFAALRTTPVAVAHFPASVTAFRDRMDEIARTGSYAEIIAAMLAAEWMYASWCGRAVARRSAEPHLARWVALHAGPDFAAGVDWLKGEIDAAAEQVDVDQRDLLVQRFGETLRLEFAFHSAPLR